MESRNGIVDPINTKLYDKKNKSKSMKAILRKFNLLKLTPSLCKHYHRLHKHHRTEPSSYDQLRLVISSPLVLHPLWQLL